MKGRVAASSKDGSSQDLVSLGIHHDLHKTLRLALLNGTTDLRHRPPAIQRVATAFARIIVQKIRPDNFSIVEGRVGECAFPVAIPQRPDSREAGVQLVINDNVPRLSCRESGHRRN